MEKVKKIAEECKVQVGASDGKSYRNLPEIKINIIFTFLINLAEDVAGVFKYEPAANDKAKCLNACCMQKLGIVSMQFENFLKL